MKKLLLLCIVVISHAVIIAQKPATKDIARPKLVIGIVVDQMRWDYLYRYYDRYSENGFKRMLREGFSCENTYINYLPTVTAIGHSTIYTGSVPAIHGIAGNNFTIQETGKKLYCTQDDSMRTLGANNDEGQMSPRNLLTSTITDQLKLATNFRSKVIGISLKDRGSILPAGHFADAAYWCDDHSATWISSSFYMDTLPGWVNKFNNQRLHEKYLGKEWNTLYPIETYRQSLNDTNAYEGVFKGTTPSRFPIQLPLLIASNGGDFIKFTPFGNTFTLDLVKAAVINEKLGNNKFGVTDFLAVSFSSTDYVGHRFAVNSVKMEDTYLRLDKDLADMFAFLDKQVGPGQYTAFLTADHGAAHNPQFFMDMKGNGGYFDSKSVITNLNKLLETKFGESKLVADLGNYQVNFNNKIIADKKLDPTAVRAVCVQYLRTVEGIAFAVDMDRIGEANIPALLRERIINGYNFKRSGGIQIILEPQYYSGTTGATGTTHGSWNSYDAHIPLLWLGWGIKKGTSNKPANMTDIAPTLAALLHIEEPNGNIGVPLTEVLK